MQNPRYSEGQRIVIPYRAVVKSAFIVMVGRFLFLYFLKCLQCKHPQDKGLSYGCAEKGGSFRLYPYNHANIIFVARMYNNKY